MLARNMLQIRLLRLFARKKLKFGSKPQLSSNIAIGDSAVLSDLEMIEPDPTSTPKEEKLKDFSARLSTENTIQNSLKRKQSRQPIHVGEEEFTSILNIDEHISAYLDQKLDASTDAINQRIRNTKSSMSLLKIYK